MTVAKRDLTDSLYATMGLSKAIVESFFGHQGPL